MTLKSQDYAALAEDAYEDRAVGRRDPSQETAIDIGGHMYKVLEHVNDRRTGYQGTVYLREDTNEVIVAHRGTEQILHDALIADAGMVVARTNTQAPEAIALTRRAVEWAEQKSELTGKHMEVSVTGHSLGGALAQVTAHHFDLKGETFNAYGAASLGYRIPEGGNAMVNHVMAADPVSAASGHYGQVRIYANPNEISNLHSSGFRNGAVAQFLVPDSALLAAGRSLQSHKMENFLAEKSVLDKPETQALAKENSGMISEYRDKLEFLRGGVTTITRGGMGNAADIIDRIRGPLDAGEPARKVTEEEQRRSSSLRMDDAQHPGYMMFLGAQRGVQEQDARVGRSPDIGSTQLAGSLAAEMKAAGGERIDSVLMNKDASRTFGVQGDAADPAHLRVSVETATAMQVPLEQSTQRMEQQIVARQVAQQSLDQQMDQQQTQTRTMQA